MRHNSSDDVHADKKSQTGINQTTKGKIYTALNKPKIKARSWKNTSERLWCDGTCSPGKNL